MWASRLARLAGWVRPAQAPYLWVADRVRALAFLAAVLAVVGPLLWVEYRGGWQLMRQLQVRNAADAADDWLRVPLEVAGAGAMDADVVLLLGGSASRELTPSDAYMSAALTNLCGRPVRFLNASTSSQLFGEAWAIADAVPPEKLKLVVVSMNLLRFEESPVDVARAVAVQRLPFHMPQAVRKLVGSQGHAAPRPFPELPVSAWLKRYRGQLARAAGPDFQAFLAAGAARPFQAASHLYAPPALPPERKAAIVAQMAAERVPVYMRSHAQGAALWTGFVREFATPRRPVLFLQLPGSRQLEPMMARVRALYDADLAQLRQAGAPVEAVRGSEVLQEDDFLDQQHLLASGREKIAAGLAAQFAAHLADCTGSAR